MQQIREVCDRHKLWMHVDAAWGTAAAFSSRRDAFLSGIETSDSVAWDAHKVEKER